MRDFKKNATKALAVYLKRGEEAVAELKDGNVDKADEILLWRNAAFHNFKVMDEFAKESGIDIAKNLDVLSLWRNIQEIDEQLAESLEDARTATKLALMKMRKARGKIGHYRSGKIENPSFAKSV
jgi:hypothetical protein